VNPRVRANNGLDQAFVARDFRCITVFRPSGGILRLCRPRTSDFVAGAIPAGGTSDPHLQSVAGNDDALKRINGGGRAIGVFVLLMRFEGGKDRALNLCG